LEDPLNFFFKFFKKFFLFFFFDSTEISTQNFEVAKQVLCHLSHSSSLLCSDYFGDGGLAFCPGGPGPQFSDFIFPTIAGMPGMHHHTQFSSFEMGHHGLFY
jgi:hypothetical protein